MVATARYDFVVYGVLFKCQDDVRASDNAIGCKLPRGLPGSSK